MKNPRKARVACLVLGRTPESNSFKADEVFLIIFTAVLLRLRKWVSEKRIQNDRGEKCTHGP